MRSTEDEREANGLCFEGLVQTFMFDTSGVLLFNFDSGGLPLGPSY